MAFGRISAIGLIMAYGMTGVEVMAKAYGWVWTLAKVGFYIHGVVTNIRRDLGVVEQ
jgi:hypothetical protein